MARELGYKSINELLNTLSPDEINEWKAYYILEPFGPREELKRALTIYCGLLNTTPRKEGDKRVFKPEEFMTNFEKLEEEFLDGEDSVNVMEKARKELRIIAKNVNSTPERKRGKLGKLVKRKKK